MFSVDGVKFILVYNPKLISSIVKQKYGCGDFEANNYIRKFVESEYKFFVNPYFLSNFIQSEASKLHSQNAIGEREYRFISQGLSDSIARTLIKYNRYALRDVKQFLPSIKLYSSGFSGQNNNGFWLSIAFLKFLDRDEYENIINYLAKKDGKMAQEGSPKRSTFLTLMKIYSDDQKTNEDFVHMFENYYKNFREYFV